MTVIDQNERRRIRDRVVALTRDLILIPTIPALPNERERGFHFVKNHVDVLDEIRVREYQHHGFPSFVAAPYGCDMPEILLVAHLDVIAHQNLTVYRSDIRNGRIYGPGAGDMKGSLAILLELFRTIHSRYPGAPLGLAVTTDEETGGQSGIGYLFNQVGIRCAEAIIPDGGSLNELTIEEKGILHLRVSCHGTPAHAARPWLGNNPIERLMDRLQAVRHHFEEVHHTDHHWHPTCSVTIIDTENETRNRVPALARAVLDIRFPAPHTASGMVREVTQVLGAQVEAEVIIAAEPTEMKPDPLYALMTEEETGQPVQLARDDGGSDARFLCALGIPVAMSRPLVGDLHAVTEWIDIESMVTFYRICERYIEKKLGL